MKGPLQRTPGLAPAAEKVARDAVSVAGKAAANAGGFADMGRVRGRGWWPRNAAAAMWALSFAGTLIADEPRAALIEAVERAPALQAARQRVDAAQSRVEASGRLANPEAEGIVSRGPGGRDMWELNVKQPLPKRGEREADRDRARAAVTMAQAGFALAASELAAETATALAEAEGAQARARIMQAQRVRFDAVLKSIEARLATATTTRVADRLTLQTRVSSMQLEIEAAERTASDATAEVRGRLGLAVDATVPAFAAPTLQEISFDESAASNAALARVAEADAAARIARAGARPSTAIGLHFERERGNGGNDDRVGVALSSELPWRSRSYARAEVRAAESERGAALAEGAGARFRINSALSRVERAERLAENARQLAGETRSRLDAQYDALVRAAGAGPAAGGGSTVLMVVEIFDQVAAAELKVIEADTAARAARAELWRYVPVKRLVPTEHRAGSDLASK